MALTALSKTLLSRMSITIPSSPVTAPPQQLHTGSSSAGTGSVSSSPLSMVAGNQKGNGVGNGRDSVFLSGSFSPIKNMELYPPRAKFEEEDCTSEEVPFSLLNGESTEYVGSLAGSHLRVYFTNYRVLATQENGFYSVPLGLIEGIEMQTNKETVTVLCRDARIFRLTFNSPNKARSFLTHIQGNLRPCVTDHRHIFAFVYGAYHKDLKLDRGSGTVGVSPTGTEGVMSFKDIHREDVVTMEYRRLGMGSVNRSKSERLWRISQCNNRYEMCQTYPKLIVVPQSVSDEELLQAAKFRMSGRLPVVVWRHSNGCVILRSSQPLVGVLSWRSADDEKLLFAISQACSKRRHLVEEAQSSLKKQCIGNGNAIAHEDFVSGVIIEDSCDEDIIDDDVPQLTVMDLRSYTATLGNRAKGGGSECTDYYPNCDVQFKSLPNIHSVRKSFQQLRLVLASNDQTSFLSDLEGTQWLSFLCQLLGVACEVVNVIHDSCQPVLVHCSDGWDRTTQIVTLAELMLDPYYRTIKGFQVLIEREWLSYGHKFGDRCGHTSDDTNQRCPVFLQWLDCVHQMIRQFPCDFQFNEQFLVKLGQHAYSCLFGTFLGNSMKEREAWRVEEDTTSLWVLLHEGNSDMMNYLYQHPKGELKVLKPVASIHSMFLWRAMYCTPLLTPYLQPPASLPLTDLYDEQLVQKFVTNPDNSEMRVPGANLIAQQTNSSEDISASASKANGADLKTAGTITSLDVNDDYAKSNQIQEKSEDSLCTDSDTEIFGSSSANTELSPNLGNDVSSIETSPSLGIIGGDTESPHTSGAGNTYISPSLANDSDTLTGLDINNSNSNSSPGSNALINTVERMALSGELMHNSSGDVVTSERKNEPVKDISDTVEAIPNNLSYYNCHENLHIQMRSGSQFPHSKTGFDISVIPGNNESCQVPSSHSKTHEYYDAHVALPPQTHLLTCSSILEMHPMQKNPLNLGKQFVPGEDAEEENADKAMCCFPRENTPTNCSRFNIGVDGLPCYDDAVQIRLKELKSLHLKEVRELTIKLKKATDKVTFESSDSSHIQVTEDLHKAALDASESPSSLTSWDCVEDDGEGVRWIPDHAATHCSGCGGEFWTARRKHHCRSCGKVFCGSCSNFFCQVPHEQLYDDVRVCEKCYFKLDGHLKQKSLQSKGPT